MTSLQPYPFIDDVLAVGVFRDPVRHDNLKGPLMNSPRPHRVGGGRTVATLREHIAVRRAIADQVISLARLLGRPVRTDTGARVGRVSDVVVRWDSGVAHPPVVACLIRVGSGLALVEMGDVVLRQNEIRLRCTQRMVWGPIRNKATWRWPVTSLITS